MIPESELSKLCLAAGLRPVFSSKPSWIDKNNLEGVEIQNGKVVSFWVKDLQRIYGEPAGEKIYQLVEKANSNDKTDINEQKKECTPQPPIALSSGICIPSQMTNALLEKWKKMTTFDRMLLFQKTNPEYIKMKPVGKGQEVPYVEGNVMIQEANIAFLFDWSCGIDKVEIGDTAVCVYGWIEVQIDEKRIRRSSVGDQEINAKMTKYLAIKAAHTDMIKKGLSLFGFNGDVYRGDV